MEHAQAALTEWEPTFEPSSAARVLALQGTWAKLWFPESDETLWVDLAQVEFEPAPAQPNALAGRD